MAPPKCSVVYKLFDISQDSDHATCKLCNESIKCRRSDEYSSLHRHSMLRHLRRKHPSSISQSMDISDKSVGINMPKKFTTENIPTFMPPKQDISSFQMQVSSNISNNSHQTRNFVESEDLKLIHPFSLIISGPTSSGKSTLLFQILENLHENTKPSIKSYFHLWYLSRCL